MTPAAQYPVSLSLEGRRCLVVGGGRVAERKVAGLLACGARVHVVAPELGQGLREAAQGAHGRLTWEQRPYRRGEAGGYWLVLAATGDPQVSRAVFEDGEALGVWVNCADDPDSCSFTLPAVLRRGPLTVAVSTSGASPALARWIRERLAEQIGPEYAQLADLLSEQRQALRAAGRSTEEADWQGAIGPDMLELLRAGEVEAARERLRSCL
jgi:precorrin-2 dehydrogenase/sirohydrochlorin ferrochelatase